MAIDRSKFKASNIVEMKQEEDKVNALVGKTSGNNDFIELTPGLNKIRFYPTHPDSKSSQFLMPKAVSWIPQEVEIKDDKGEPTGKTEVKRRPVFNSKVHGDTEMDLIEEYIKFATTYFTENIDDKEALKKKLSPIIDWQLGLKPKVTYIGYAHKIMPDGSKKFGRIEVSCSVKEQLNTISNTGDSSSPIVMDPFTDPDKGKAVSIKYNKDNPDKKKIYSTTLLWQDDFPLLDAELERFITCESLEKLYKKSFKRSDFEKQLAGLKIFDDEKKLGILSHDAFLDIVEKIDAYYPEESPEGETEEESPEAQEMAQEQMESEGNSCLLKMNREQLLKFIKDNEFDLAPKATHSEARIREDLSNAAQKLNILLDDIYADWVKNESQENKSAENTATSSTGTNSRLSAMKDKLTS